MAGAVLEVSGLSKKYCRDMRGAMYYALRDIAAELLRPEASGRLRRGEFWAIDDVSLRLDTGEALCIAGQNGAGKSTLLKLLYGLLKPDRGSIRVRGRSGGMIELGAGLNPHLTGRENVLLAAAVEGIGGRGCGAVLDRVIDFAEIEEFIDTPVLSYSSGMRARLAFATAIAFAPDLLLVDEVLSVGDTVFQRKCLNFMRGYLDDGGALLFVSHNVHQIQAVCSRGMLLEHGRVAFAGSAVETVSMMLDEDGGSSAPTDDRLFPDSPIVIRGFSAAGQDGGEIATGRAIRLSVRYTAAEATEIEWGFSILTRDDWICVTGGNNLRPTPLEEGEGELSCIVPRLPLLPGVYLMRVGINDARSGLLLATSGWTGSGLVFEVKGTPSRLSNAQRKLGQLVELDVQWPQ
jgi:lipopolysaccharide transport system ATP-binding protein